MHPFSPTHVHPINYEAYRRRAQQLRREAYSRWIDAGLMQARKLVKATLAARWRAAAKPAPRLA
jgi:hypothetical protein